MIKEIRRHVEMDFERKNSLQEIVFLTVKFFKFTLNK